MQAFGYIDPTSVMDHLIDGVKATAGLPSGVMNVDMQEDEESPIIHWDIRNMKAP